MNLILLLPIVGAFILATVSRVEPASPKGQAIAEAVQFLLVLLAGMTIGWAAYPHLAWIP